MKHYLPLLYIAIAIGWFLYDPRPQSRLTLFVIIVIYFIVASFKKAKTIHDHKEEEQQQLDEFHNDFSKVGSANPDDQKINSCSCSFRK